MRLKISVASANEQLIVQINRGYETVSAIRQDYNAKKGATTYDTARDNNVFEEELYHWANDAAETLDSIFPTDSLKKPIP